MVVNIDTKTKDGELKGHIGITHYNTLELYVRSLLENKKLSGLTLLKIEIVRP